MNLIIAKRTHIKLNLSNKFEEIKHTFIRWNFWSYLFYRDKKCLLTYRHFIIVISQIFHIYGNKDEDITLFAFIMNINFIFMIIGGSVYNKWLLFLKHTVHAILHNTTYQLLHLYLNPLKNRHFRWLSVFFYIYIFSIRMYAI